MLKLGVSIKLIKEVKVTVEKLQPPSYLLPTSTSPAHFPFKPTPPLPASPPWPLSKIPISSGCDAKDNVEKFQSSPPMSPPPETMPASSLSPLLTPPAWVSPPSVSPPWSSTPSPASSSTSSPASSSGKERSVVQRKSTSLGALGQALHGEQLGLEPREDSRANAVQICPICRFQAATKNPYRNLQVGGPCFTQKTLIKQTKYSYFQDHLVRVHFMGRIKSDLPAKKP